MKNKQYWIGAYVSFGLDLITKIWALIYLEVEEEFLINKYFSIQRIWNESNILASVNFDIPINVFRMIWILFAMCIAFCIYWVSVQPSMNEKNMKTNFAKTGLFLIMGGMFGNCFDRVFRKEGVVDFIRLNFLENLIPIMNIADVFIYVGLICIIISWLIIFKELFFKHIIKYEKSI